MTDSTLERARREVLLVGCIKGLPDCMAIQCRKLRTAIARLELAARLEQAEKMIELLHSEQKAIACLVDIPLLKDRDRLRREMDEAERRSDVQR